jgi:cyclin-dependent kinase 12/13
MGCVQGRAASASPCPRASQVSLAEAGPTNADAVKKENGAGADAAVGEEAPPQQPKKERKRHGKADPWQGSFSNRTRGEQVTAGWPPWLAAVAGEAINGWAPRRADSFEKIDKVFTASS